MDAQNVSDTILKMVGSAVLLALGGCASLPHFNDSLYRYATDASRDLAPTVNDITHEVQCELLQAQKLGVNYNTLGADYQKQHAADKVLGQLASSNWLVNVNLTLQVTDDEGVNPSLSYIDPLSAANTNFTGTLSGQVSEEQDRNVTIQFTLYLYPGTPTTDACDPSKNRASALHGNLGVEEVIKTGLPYAVGLPDNPYLMQAIGIGKSSSTGTPVFGSTIDFSLVYGAGANPTWTLTHFAGPGPASGSLLTAMRTHKDTLVLSLSPSASASAGDVTAAAKAAQDNSTRMILQRLLP
jgi:hypothetical protein